MTSTSTPTPASTGIDPFRRPLDVASEGAAFLVTDRWVSRAVWLFVGLGVLLRLARYLMNYPLWWDEAFVAVNFLRRGYLDLLRPLDYGQVCPLLFLGVALTVVKLLGFSEMTLRLFPLVCAMASVVLFRRVAGLVLRGVPLVLAVAIFAVSYHPIRHAADVKPYASDLLVALSLLGLAMAWWRAPGRTGWLWALTAASPIALALSHPSVFVAGGIGVGLAPAVWRTGRLGPRVALGAFGLATVATFLGLFVTFTGAQAEATLPVMRPDWMGSFPPLDSPLALGRWLVTIHAGAMFAYPCGGEHGASSLTLLLVVVAAGVLGRRGARTILAIILAPFVLAMVAAALHRYPYGGAARFMQYLAPSICLMAGLGAARVFMWLPRPRLRRGALRVAVLVLAVVGLAPVAADLAHPYRAFHAHRARQFAQAFWPALARDAELACLRWDLEVAAWNSIYLDIPVALCNQAIYSPHRQRQGGPRWEKVSTTRPLRCVLTNAPTTDSPELVAWLEAMTTRYDLRTRETFVVDMAKPGARPRLERHEVFEFVPRSDGPSHGARLTGSPQDGLR